MPKFALWKEKVKDKKTVGIYILCRPLNLFFFYKSQRYNAKWNTHCHQNKKNTVGVSLADFLPGSKCSPGPEFLQWFDLSYDTSNLTLVYSGTEESLWIINILKA